MARQPRTRKPKPKFQDQQKVFCHCGAEKFLYITKTGAWWQCSNNLTH